MESLNSKKNGFFKKYGFWLIICAFAAIYVALMAIFTPLDYHITNELYNPQLLFSKICEVTGPIFMPFFGIYAIVSLFFCVKIKRTVLKIAFYAALSLLYAYYFFMGSFTLKYSYLPALFVPAIVSYPIWTAFCTYLNKIIIKNGLKCIHFKIALVTFFTVFAAMGGVDIIKPICGRIRYNELKGEYLPWYVIQSHLFNSSFPSGHAARSSLVLLFVLIPSYFQKKNTALKICLYVLGFAFIALVSFSRMLEGMHYPTDLLTGAAITLFTFFISKKLITG